MIKLPQFSTWQILTAIVFFVVLLVQLQIMDVGINLADEGLVVEGARQYAAGTYQPDVFAHYSSRYAVESKALAAGNSLLTLRILWALLRAATAALIFAIVAYMVSENAAFPMVLLFLAAPGPWHKAWIPFLTLVVMAAFLYFRHRPLQSKAILLGALCGLTFAIHPYTGLLLFPVVAIAAFRGVAAAPGHPGRWQAPLFVTSGFILIGFGLAWWARKVAWSAFFVRHWAIAKSDWLGVQEFFWSLITGAERGLFFASFFDVALILLAVAFYLYWRRPQWLLEGWAVDLLGIALIAAAGLLKVLARFDESHFLQNWPPFLVLAGVLGGWTLKHVKGKWPRIAVGLLAIWMLGFVWWALEKPDYYIGGPGMSRGREMTLDNDFAPMQVTRNEKKEIEAVVAATHALAPAPDDPIFVVPFAPMFYALADRPNVVPLVLFDRPENLLGISEERILELLQARPPRAVIEERVVTDGKSRNRLRGVLPRVTDWLEKNYRPREEAGNFVIYGRIEDQPQPPSVSSSSSPSASSSSPVASSSDASSSPAVSSSSPVVSSSSPIAPGGS